MKSKRKFVKAVQKAAKVIAAATSKEDTNYETAEERDRRLVSFYIMNRDKTFSRGFEPPR